MKTSKEQYDECRTDKYFIDLLWKRIQFYIRNPQYEFFIFCYLKIPAADRNSLIELYRDSLDVVRLNAKDGGDFIFDPNDEVTVDHIFERYDDDLQAFTLARFRYAFEAQVFHLVGLYIKNGSKSFSRIQRHLATN